MEINIADVPFIFLLLILQPPLGPPPSAPVSSAVLSSFARPATPAAGNDLFDFGEFVSGFEDGVGLARPKKAAAAAAAAALSPPQPVASLAPPLSHRPSRCDIN